MNSPVTVEHLVREVAVGRNVTRDLVKTIWNNLCEYTYTCLKSNKGVVYPTLGVFQIGHLLHGGCVHPQEPLYPTFTLDERFQTVSQERGKWFPTGRSQLVQLNYQRLAFNTGLQRSVVTKVIKDLFARLGVQIMLGRPLRIDFGPVGQLRTRMKRVEFKFDKHLEVIPGAPLPDPSPSASLTWSSPAPVAQSDSAKSSIAASETPFSTANPAPIVPVHIAATPLPLEVARLLQLCRREDRIGSGCIERLTVERLLKSECSGIIQHMGALSVLDLLEAHTYGKTGKFIRYVTLATALRELSSAQLEDRHERVTADASTGGKVQWATAAPQEAVLPPSPPSASEDAYIPAAEDTYLPPATPPPEHEQESVDVAASVEEEPSEEGEGRRGGGPRVLMDGPRAAAPRRDIDDYNRALRDQRRQIVKKEGWTAKVNHTQPDLLRSSQVPERAVRSALMHPEKQVHQGRRLVEGGSRDPPEMEGFKRQRSPSPVRWEARRSVDTFNRDRAAQDQTRIEHDRRRYSYGVGGNRLLKEVSGKVGSDAGSDLVAQPSHASITSPPRSGGSPGRGGRTSPLRNSFQRGGGHVSTHQPPLSQESSMDLRSQEPLDEALQRKLRMSDMVSQMAAEQDLIDKHRSQTRRMLHQSWSLAAQEKADRKQLTRRSRGAWS